MTRELKESPKRKRSINQEKPRKSSEDHQTNAKTGLDHYVNLHKSEINERSSKNQQELKKKINQHNVIHPFKQKPEKTDEKKRNFPKKVVPIIEFIDKEKQKKENKSNLNKEISQKSQLPSKYEYSEIEVKKKHRIVTSRFKSQTVDTQFISENMSPFKPIFITFPTKFESYEDVFLLNGVGEKFQKIFHKMKISTISDLKKVSVPKLRKIEGIGKKLAPRFHNQAAEIVEQHRELEKHPGFIEMIEKNNINYIHLQTPLNKVQKELNIPLPTKKDLKEYYNNNTFQDYDYRDISEGYIYLIMNKHPNGQNKIYVGQTSRPLYIRFHDHDIEQSGELSVAIKEFKPVNFLKIKLCEIYNMQQYHLDALEYYFIKEFGSIDSDIGYNRNEGGAYGKASDETKRIISEKQTISDEDYAKSTFEKHFKIHPNLSETVIIENLKEEMDNKIKRGLSKSQIAKEFAIKSQNNTRQMINRWFGNISKRRKEHGLDAHEAGMMSYFQENFTIYDHSQDPIKIKEITQTIIEDINEGVIYGAELKDIALHLQQVYGLKNPSEDTVRVLFFQIHKKRHINEVRAKFGISKDQINLYKNIKNLFDGSNGKLNLSNLYGKAFHEALEKLRQDIDRMIMKRKRMEQIRDAFHLTQRNIKTLSMNLFGMNITEYRKTIDIQYRLNSEAVKKRSQTVNQNFYYRHFPQYFQNGTNFESNLKKLHQDFRKTLAQTKMRTQTAKILKCNGDAIDGLLRNVFGVRNVKKALEIMKNEKKKKIESLD